ncbi:MAG: thioredoxin domain-containing protein [Candidatus Paceibacterota bacterium]
MNKDMNNTQLIAGSIIVAAVIIGLSIIVDNADRPNVTAEKTETQQEKSILSFTEPVNEEAVRPVTEEDNIRGSIDADIKIIEYSDLECPFCKRFHPVLQRVVAEHDNVAWVYRHYPIPQLHAKARQEAIASECVAELGGQDTFWTFIDRFFELSPSNDGTDLDVVFPQIVSELGISQEEFNTCLEEERYGAEIDAESVEARESGGGGTPWSILIAPDGEMYGIGGAWDYNSVSALIDEVLE